MATVVTVHIADVGAPGALRLAAARHPLRSAPGHLGAHALLAAPLSPAVLPSPSPGRVALLAFWDGAAAAERFAAGHPVAERLAGGWRATLEPVRMFGGWPGLPDGLPRHRRAVHDGPAAVLTLGRLRVGRAPEFLRTTAPAEGAAVDAPGFVWGTGLAFPPVVATCSLWESTDALSAYAFGKGGPHDAAIEAGHRHPFHKQQAFVRCRVLESEGCLGGRNPLTAGDVARSTTVPPHAGDLDHR